jgi:CHAP domain
MKYPGRVIKAGEADAAVVKAVKARLNTVLNADADPAIKLDATDPTFGPRVTQTVKLFQARNVDGEGRPLVQDGQLGSISWLILFGEKEVVATPAAASEFLAKVIAVAGKEADANVREVPANSNSGPKVEAYQKRAGSSKGLAWCCSFMYWCFDETAKGAGQLNPMVKTAGCLDHWQRAAGAGAKRVPKNDAIANPALVRPGMVFIMSHGKGKGHTGIVESVKGGLLSTIEGNTDASKTREGGGVYRLTRKVTEINVGFIDYAGVAGKK